MEFGPNRVEKVRGVTLGHRFLKGFTHFFALILGVAAALAFLAEWYEPGGGMATLGVAILGVILINGLFSFWQEYRAEKALSAPQKLLPHQVKAVRAGKVRQVPAEDAELTRIGPDTPCGEYMRRFWQPICYTDDLKDLLHRLREHEKQDTRRQTDLAEAA